MNGGIHGSSAVMMYCDEACREMALLRKGDWVLALDADDNYVRGTVTCVVKYTPLTPFILYDNYYAGSQLIRHKLDDFCWTPYCIFEHQTAVISTDPMYGVVLSETDLGIIVNRVICAPLDASFWIAHDAYSSGLIEFN